MRHLIALFLIIGTASAAEPTACPPLASAQDVLDCVLRAHPEAKSAETLLKQSEAFERAAAQRTNPEAEANALFGGSQDQVQVSLLHTFETGGKRSRRVDQARAEGELLRAEALAVKERLAIDTVVDLHRLRQIREELRVSKEALETFSRIARQLLSRPRRSPEQQVSLAIFRLAEQDYALRRSRLESEDAGLRREFALGLGAPLPDTEALLPKEALQWPELGAEPGALRGSTALRAAAASSAARAQVGVARAASYPDLRVGPSVQRQKNGPGEGSTTLIGAGLSMALPLYQRNAAGRLLAARGAEAAAARSDAALAVLAAERDAELARYRSATAALVKAGGHAESEARHEELDGLFERGLVPSALVIEAHRQVFDFTSDLHEQELAAVRALWTIYAIEGRALTEKL